MRVYLVYSGMSSNHEIPCHPGLRSISAVLRESGHYSQIGYLDSVEQYNDIVEPVESFEPDVVGVHKCRDSIRSRAASSALTKAKQDCVTFCGGTYMTLSSEVVLVPESSSLDCIVLGDGKYALLKLTEKIG